MPNPSLTPSSKSTVAAFDFDVTITTKDTFVPFLFRSFGRPRVLLAFSRLTLEAIKVLTGHSNRDQFKGKIIGLLFDGESLQRMSSVGAEHAGAVECLIRPAALRRIAWHKERGHRLVMVSASLDFYLGPVAKTLGFDDLLCTRVSRDGATLNRSIDGANCRGPEKVARLVALLGDRSAYELHAYGDSAGDHEMLAMADHPHYRAFHEGGELA